MASRALLMGLCNDSGNQFHQGYHGLPVGFSRGTRDSFTWHNLRGQQVSAVPAALRPKDRGDSVRAAFERTIWMVHMMEVEP